MFRVWTFVVSCFLLLASSGRESIARPIFAAPFLSFDVGLSPQHMAIGDLNGDGKLDLVEAGGTGISVLLGNGDGTLGPAVGYPMGGGDYPQPYSVAIRDLNADGKADVVTANWMGWTVSVRLGNGDGKLGAETAYAMGSYSYPIFVVVGDLNEDGKPDLVVSNEGYNTVSVLLGNGDGTFGAKTDFATGSHPFDLAIGDLDKDGKLDLVVTNDADYTVSVSAGQWRRDAPSQDRLCRGVLPGVGGDRRSGRGCEGRCDRDERMYPV